jgi:hypothetical protein
MTATTEKGMAEFLSEAIEFHCEENLSPEDDIEIRSFRDAGVLTGNEGLVITMPDRSEFQITIIQSA